MRIYIRGIAAQARSNQTRSFVISPDQPPNKIDVLFFARADVKIMVTADHAQLRIIFCHDDISLELRRAYAYALKHIFLRWEFQLLCCNLFALNVSRLLNGPGLALSLCHPKSFPLSIRMFKVSYWYENLDSTIYIYSSQKMNVKKY